MTRAGLIEALHRKADEDEAAIWREARAEAERHRLDAAGRVAAERARLDRELAATARLAAEAAAAAAGRQARDLRISAAAALADRLYDLARAELPQLRQQRDEQLFSALAAELPPCDWQGIRVNPADRAPARQRFPGATVECDAAISGGLEAAAERGRIRVDNTLETRLRRAWPDLLPGLLAELQAGSMTDGDGDGPAA